MNPQKSPDRILKQNLAEIRNRESVEATLKTLSHFGSGSATKIQFASSSKAARGFFGFFGLDSTQAILVRKMDKVQFNRKRAAQFLNAARNFGQKVKI